MTPLGAWVAVIAAVIGGMTGIAALVRTLQEKPRMRADTMAIVNQRALDTMQKIQENADATQTRLDLVEAENRRHEDRIGELEDRDDRHVRALRMLIGYVAELHTVFEQAGLVPPPNPLADHELDELLVRIRRTIDNAQSN